MSKKYATEIEANIERAEESLNAAKELLHKHYHDFAASRAYYAVFYAATAVLLCEKRSFSKHSAVISAFHKHVVKTGNVDKQCGKDLNWLFELRNVGDYGVTTHVPKQDAERAIKAAEHFLQAAKDAISKYE
ncbi:MAG: HEPN domain-containing protein [Candidatus Vecturithrix sp.]|jgi:uncharacterized protein (UPF0332 family)|nr:HEPN domain-containing protein [Candidatus Vecturithrix sp.]